MSVRTSPGHRIGIDVGGTHTDAVLMCGGAVLAKHKSSTTANVTDGIVAALRAIVDNSAVSMADVDAVMIGTTHFTNAFVEGRDLESVAIVRLGYPATRAVPPMCDWPTRLRSAIEHQWYLCHGGYEFDGRQLTPLDPAELRRVGEQIARAGLQSVAVVGVFASVNPEAEREAAAILADALPGVPISISSEIGRTGLLPRENATIVNATLRGLARRTVRSFRRAVDDLGIRAPLFVSQNDGTLAGLDFTERYPVTTFTSGPTNSMRGAAFLSGRRDCSVIDIGGTTADIGVLQHGFPRQTTLEAKIGGVSTNFRLPDVLSLGVGGGSVVDLALPVAVGPRSVGSGILDQALVFGGDVLTATDIAVAGGRAVVGDVDRVAHLRREDVDAVLAQLDAELSRAVDSMRTSSGTSAVVLAGGGSILVGDELDGVSEIVRPDHLEVANAVGAAIAQVGATIERIISLDATDRREAIAEISDLALQAAAEAGGDAAGARVIDIEETAMSYLPGNQTRIKVRAVADLRTEGDLAVAH